MTIVQIFDNGAIFGADMLDIDDQTLIDQFLSAVKTIACISLATNFPTIVSVSHSLVNAYKNLIAVSIATDFEFEGSAQVSLLLSFLLVWSRCRSGGGRKVHGRTEVGGRLERDRKNAPNDAHTHTLKILSWRSFFDERRAEQLSYLMAFLSLFLFSFPTSRSPTYASPSRPFSFK
jgi:hypothetical protein